MQDRYRDIVGAFRQEVPAHCNTAAGPELGIVIAFDRTGRMKSSREHGP